MKDDPNYYEPPNDLPAGKLEFDDWYEEMKYEIKQEYLDSRGITNKYFYLGEAFHEYIKESYDEYLDTEEQPDCSGCSGNEGDR